MLSNGNLPELPGAHLSFLRPGLSRRVRTLPRARGLRLRLAPCGLRVCRSRAQGPRRSLQVDGRPPCPMPSTDSKNTMSAVLLAAGHSTRMGREKALLEVGGEPLWRRQRTVLARAGAGEIFLSARADQPWSTEPAVTRHFDAIVTDALPDAGPLAGIVAALEHAAHQHLAVLAIDLPRMTPGWFEALRRQCAPGIGAVAKRGAFFEPLAAIYPREILPLARAALERRELSLQHLLAQAVAAGVMRVTGIDGADPEWIALFENWNAPHS